MLKKYLCASRPHMGRLSPPIEMVHATARAYRSLIVLAAFAVVTCASIPSWSATEPASTGESTARLEHVMNRIEQHLADTRTYSARFKEEISSVGGVKRIRTGDVYYRKPDRMRWEFDSPKGAVIVSDGRTVYTYQPDLNQVVETPLKQALGSANATAFVLGADSIKRDFEYSWPSRNPADGLLHVVLKPRHGGNTMDLGVNPANYDLAMITTTDQIGNVTTIRFTKIKSDLPLHDALFSFAPPAGADIVSVPGVQQ